MSLDRNERLVYSSDSKFGSLGHDFRKAKTVDINTENQIQKTIELKRETKGRRGKPVITIHHIPQNKVADLLRILKKTCGCGGSNKNGILEIQGDHRETVIQKLKEDGYSYKWTGG